MLTVQNIIADLGGNVKVARGIGVSPSGVSEMKRRSSIPVTHWPALVRFSEAEGKPLNNDVLVAVHTNAPEQAVSA